MKQLLHELQQIQNVTILFIKFNVKLYVSRFGVTIDGRVKLQCIYMYLPRITLIQLLFIRSGAQSPYGMAKTSHLFSQDVTIFNWYLKSLIQLMVTLHLYLFIIKIMLSKHMFCNITPVFTVDKMAASASPASVTSPQEAGPANIIKMFTTYTNILTEASVRKYYCRLICVSLKSSQNEVSFSTCWVKHIMVVRDLQRSIFAKMFSLVFYLHCSSKLTFLLCVII